MATEPDKITRADIEQKFRALQTDFQGKVNDKKQSLIAAASVVGAVLLVGSYLLGRRRGRRRRSNIEFRGF